MVIPAQAGIQQRGKTGPTTNGVPACAGMTNWGLRHAKVVNGYVKTYRGVGFQPVIPAHE